jgi:hypothetical protein
LVGVTFRIVFVLSGMEGKRRKGLPVPSLGLSLLLSFASLSKGSGQA